MLSLRAFYKVFLTVALGLSGFVCSAQQAPSGHLTYCSYSCTGMAGLGKDYCELIADEGAIPKVVVALKVGNRFREPEIHAEFQVAQDVVEALQRALAAYKVYELAGYCVDEAITGGYAYRIYQEYDSGEKINASWYGHGIKPEAWSAYYFIESFFAPWRKKAERVVN